MAVIDVGAAAIDRASNLPKEKTLIDKTNPANDSGVLDTFELWFWFYAVSDCLVGTFYGSGVSATSRDYADIGSVSVGSKQTFSGLSVDVASGDWVGLYTATGYVERSTSGGGDVLLIDGDQFGTGAQTYSSYPGNAISLYATGTTAAATSIKSVNGVAYANIKAINGIAIGDIKQFNGVSNVS